MNTMLDAPFIAEEVKKALFMMHPNKAPVRNQILIA
jgi:hypothetical protein